MTNILKQEPFRMVHNAFIKSTKHWWKYLSDSMSDEIKLKLKVWASLKSIYNLLEIFYWFTFGVCNWIEFRKIKAMKKKLHENSENRLKSSRYK